MLSARSAATVTVSVSVEKVIPSAALSVIADPSVSIEGGVADVTATATVMVRHTAHMVGRCSRLSTVVVLRRVVCGAGPARHDATLPR